MESKKLEIIPLFDEKTAVIYSNTIFLINHEKILYIEKTTIRIHIKTY